MNCLHANCGIWAIEINSLISLQAITNNCKDRKSLTAYCNQKKYLLICERTVPCPVFYLETTQGQKLSLHANTTLQEITFYRTNGKTFLRFFIKAWWTDLLLHQRIKGAPGARAPWPPDFEVQVYNLKAK